MEREIASAHVSASSILAFCTFPLSYCSVLIFLPFLSLSLSSCVVFVCVCVCCVVCGCVCVCVCVCTNPIPGSLNLLAVTVQVGQDLLSHLFFCFRTRKSHESVCVCVCGLWSAWVG